MATSSMSATNGTMDDTRASFEIRELKKIVELKERIVSGRHARYKMPSSMVPSTPTTTDIPLRSSLDTTIPATVLPSIANTATTTSFPGLATIAPNVEAKKRITSDVLPIADTLSTVTKAPIVDATQSVNQKGKMPIHKSTEAIRVKNQLKMRRIDNALKEQADQERVKPKPLVLAAEAIPDFDVSEVLAKALHHVSTGTEIGVLHSVGSVDVPPRGPRSLSDSFDENTFYSSQPYSNAPSMASSTAEGIRGQGQVAINSDVVKPSVPVSSKVKATEDVQMQGSRSPGEIVPDSSGEEASRTNSVKKTSNPGPNVPSNVSSTVAAEAQHITPAQYGKDFVDITHSDSEMEETFMTSNTGGLVSHTSTPHLNADADLVAVQDTTDELMRDAFPPTPEVLSKATSLLDTRNNRDRPSNISTPTGPSKLRTNVITTQASSSKVDELVQDVSTADNTPKQSVKKDKKRKNKKEKQEARSKKTKSAKGKKKEKNAVAVSPITPFIKAEPLSPSPNVTMPLPRPQKRRRPDHESNAAGLNYDEAPARAERYETVDRPMLRQNQERQRPAYLASRGDGAMFEEVDSPYSSSRRPPRINTQTNGGTVTDHRPLQLASAYATHQPMGDIRPGRAGSVMVLDDSPHGGPRFYREPPLRYSIRPNVDRERSRSPVVYIDERTPVMMAPPRQRRIVVDEYGQQFYAPEAAPVRVVSRQSMAPISYRDDGLIYEQPVRTTQRPVEETFERDGVLYRRVSPTANIPLGPPRRVVTQPAYEVDHRAYREREYSVRPMAPPSDAYARPVETVDRRQMSHFEAPPSRYVEYGGSNLRPDTRMSVAPQMEYMPSATPVYGGPESAQGLPRHGVRRTSKRQYEGAGNMY